MSWHKINDFALTPTMLSHPRNTWRKMSCFFHGHHESSVYFVFPLPSMTPWPEQHLRKAFCFWKLSDVAVLLLEIFIFLLEHLVFLSINVVTPPIWGPWNLWYCSVTMGTADFLNKVRIRQDGKRGKAFWVTKRELNNRLIVTGGKRGVRFSGVMRSHGSGNKARYVGGNEKHHMTAAKSSHKWLEINPAGITECDGLIVSPETCHSSLGKLLQTVTRELVTSEKEKYMNKHTFKFQYVCMLGYWNWGSKSLLETNIFIC